ncbi:hypothetical protein TrLO_g8991 [Triparma laevis f. longispina]|uniref:FACT complex subunit n=1 Tax=Triparma laevis f. longispina TaxID=1714387 RepID=A0A9W7AX31_9STRA|nr:hypothetical protein TrLO_g8991 [Triparma laevis f. longispina]
MAENVDPQATSGPSIDVAQFHSRASKLIAQIKKHQKEATDSFGEGEEWSVSMMKGSTDEGWLAALKDASVASVDVSKTVSLSMAVKEDSEYDILKKAAVLTNKIFKLSFIPKMEEIIDAGKSVSHEKISEEVNSAIEDPSKIKLKVPVDDVEACYFPIIQSGGDYSLKVSATSKPSKMKFDVIIASIGARYQSYCASMTRTYFVDPPKKVTGTYETLIDVQNACLDVMKPGNPLSGVRKAAVQHLKSAKREDLIPCLPKNLGFAMGLDYRDSDLILNDKNATLFRANMVFNLTVGFENVPLTDADKTELSSKAEVKNLDKFSCAIGDTYRVLAIDIESGGNNLPELYTKATKQGGDVVYTINEKGDDSDDDDSDESGDGDSDSDDSAAKAKGTMNVDGKRASSRLKTIKDSNVDAVESAIERAKIQADLLKKKNETRLREIARKNQKGGDADEEEEAQELKTYNKGEDMPSNVLPNQVKVDMATECVILPISGNPVPFHISTIKNVVMPEPDRATYLRINFHSAGVTLGKDVPANVVKLIEKHSPFATFIKELTFRSLDKNNLTSAYRQISELRKRVRQREQKEAEESNLVEQEKLVRMKEGKVPRLSDLTMRPALGKGRKTIGQLEAHENGLRFRSNKGDTLDIIYNNIKNCLFQPCEKELMVIVHFNLKNPIMIGSKKHENVQFYTEVVEASEQVDGNRRSMYDPDEMDQEQRERQLRKRLNEAFQGFCKKVELVSGKYGNKKEFDIPYRDLAFTGTPNKEMCTIQPTLNCLVNLTETPFFVVDLEKVDHVHFERITFSSKAFDVIIILKDFTKQPMRIDMIANADKDGLQSWLTDMEIPYTEAPMSLNWKQIMAEVVQDDRFYEDTEVDEVTPKPAGWSFLAEEDEGAGAGDEEEEDESEFSEEEGEESEEVSDASDSDGFDEEDSEESDFDGDEELEEEGMDWDEMEKEAAISDKKRARDQAEMERSERQGGGNKKKRR